MPKWIGESLLSLAFAAVGVFFGIGGVLLGKSKTGAVVGPGDFPKILGAALFLLGVINLARVLSNRAKSHVKFETNKVVFAGSLLSLLYIYLMPRLGYFYVTPIFGACLLVLLGYRNPLKVALVAGGFTLSAYVVFYRLLSVSLPV